MTTQREPGVGAHINWKHRDGPLLVCADGTLHWLTWLERIQFWLGLTNLARLNDKFGAKRPCGICGRLVSWGSLGPREYHDCKPVPRAALETAQAEIERLCGILAAVHDATTACDGAVYDEIRCINDIEELSRPFGHNHRKAEHGSTDAD